MELAETNLIFTNIGQARPIFKNIGQTSPISINIGLSKSTLSERIQLLTQTRVGQSICFPEMQNSPFFAGGRTWSPSYIASLCGAEYNLLRGKRQKRIDHKTEMQVRIEEHRALRCKCFVNCLIKLSFGENV